MPTYEYACSDCNAEWEQEQSIKDDPIKECPRCHHQTAKRQISRGTGFILKGGGWYSDLYSSPSKPSTSESSSSSSSESKSSETKSETKTESKSETKGDGGGSTPSAKTSAAAA